MTTATLAGTSSTSTRRASSPIPEEWNEELAPALAAQIGITLTDEHWEVLRFLRADFAETGETATLRRVSTRSRRPRQAAVRPVPAEAGQEDGLRRRAAQAAGLRLTTAPTPPQETRHDHHSTRAPAPRRRTRASTTPRARAASSRSSAPRATSTWPTRG